MLRLWVPGLLPPDADTMTGLSLPRLQRLLAQGRRAVSAGHWLNALPGTLGSHEPVAAFWARLDGVVGEEPFWLLAQPFHCLADHQGIYPQGMDLALSAAETLELLGSLNAHLQQDGLCLYQGASGQWYLNLPARSEIELDDWTRLIGRNLYPHLPRGVEQNYFRSLLTELQMLLYRHPVNETRRAQGRPEVSCLWFWAQGQSRAPIDRPRRLISDQPLVQAAARALDIDWAGSTTVPYQTQDLVLLTGLESQFWQDIEGWQQRLTALEPRWQRPLVLDTGLRCWHWSYSEVWRFWRRFRGWEPYLGQGED